MTQQIYGIMVNELRIPYGRRLRHLRLARGWSQDSLAQQLCRVSGYLTVTRHEVARWERGDRIPGRFWQQHLAAALNVHPDQLAHLPARSLAPTGAKFTQKLDIPGFTEQINQAVTELDTSVLQMKTAAHHMLSVAAHLEDLSTLALQRLRTKRKARK